MVRPRGLVRAAPPQLSIRPAGGIIGCRQWVTITRLSTSARPVRDSEQDLPCVNTEAMELHLAEIARTVATDAHALLIVDGAGWHDAIDLIQVQHF